MQELSKQAIQHFRSNLPPSHNLEMWVNETVLEYARVKSMWEQEIQAMPLEGTLLANLITVAGNSPKVDYGNELNKYEALFGTPPDYCWTMPVDQMFGKSAAAASQPATAWVSYSKFS